MRILEKLVTAVLFHFFFLFTAPSTAHIISLKLRSDSRQLIPLSDFEFTNVGHVSFVLPSVTVTVTTSSSPPADPSRIGFFLQSREDDFFLYSRETRNRDILEFQENTTICPLDLNSNSNSSQVLFTFQNLFNGAFNKSFHVTNSGMKSLLFVNCNNESQSVVTMKGRVELYNYNTDDDGTTKNYLSAGLTQLPFLSFTFSFIYISFLGFWILVCLNNRRVFNTTHLLMGGLLLLNCVHFICIETDLHYVKVTGTAHGFDVLFDAIQLFRAQLLSIVIVLIGGGCFFRKPVLKRDKLVLMIVILLEVWANANPVFPWEAVAPYNKQDWSLADVLYCIVIFFPIALSFISLNENCENDLDTDRYLGKLWLFMVLAIVYVFITRLFLPGLPTTWDKYVVKETSILVFNILMFYIFRPVGRTRIKNGVMIGLSTSSISRFYRLINLYRVSEELCITNVGFR